MVLAIAVTVPLTVVELNVATQTSPMTGLFLTGLASPSLPVTTVPLPPLLWQVARVAAAPIRLTRERIYMFLPILQEGR